MRGRRRRGRPCRIPWQSLLLSPLLERFSSFVCLVRLAALLGGLPQETSALTINRFCSSGLQAMALAAGSLTGALLAGVVTHPMDTIKTCMQGDLGQVKYKGILQRTKTVTHVIYFEDQVCVC